MLGFKVFFRHLGWILALSLTACSSNENERRNLLFLSTSQFDAEPVLGCGENTFVPTHFLRRNNAKIQPYLDENAGKNGITDYWDISFISSVALNKNSTTRQVYFYFLEPKETQEILLLHGGIEVAFDLCTETVVSISEIRFTD